MIWLGILLFFGIHLIPSIGDFRSKLINRMGPGGYKGAYSLIALLGLVLIGFGYADRDHSEIWQSPSWSGHLTIAVMPIVFILWVAAEVKGHIRKTVKHPMIIGVLLWSLAHLVANGDRASLYLFGSFALYSVYSIISSNRRGKVPDYEKGAATHDVAAVVVGLVAFVVFFAWGHEFLFGVAPPFADRLLEAF